MSITVNSISTTNFAGANASNSDDKRHVRATEVGAGAGAAIGGAKYGAGAFKRFNLGKTGDIVRLSGETTAQIKNAANAGKQVKSLWGKMLHNAKSYKNSIINWCQSTKIAKYCKPIFESKAFNKFSGALGAITAGFVFISGIGEMTNTFGKMVNNN